MSEPVTVPPIVENAYISKNITISFQETMFAYGSLYLMAIFCILLGSIRSLWFVRKKIAEKEKIESSINIKEAKRFPFVASAVLFGLYLFFKYGGEIKEIIGLKSDNNTEKSTKEVKLNLPDLIKKENLLYILLLLICWEGAVAMAHLLKPFFTWILNRLPIGDDRQPKANLAYRLLYSRGKKNSIEKDNLIDWNFDTHDVVSVAICSIVALSHITNRHWISNDLLAVAFCIYGIEELHLGSFKAGCLLLSGLFVYDIFWVFATEVMTTVATGIDAPILLQFPQDLFQSGLMAKKNAMLGLGDIVLPGIFTALLLRFDHRVLDLSENEDRHRQLVYFPVTMLAYGLGLTLTIFVMHWFKAAQPALLYLVPLCIGVPLILALIRGELKELYNYSEELLSKKDEDEQKKSD